MDNLHQLLNNSYFWTFLGTVTVAYFGYKGALVPYIEDRRRQKYANGNASTNINVKRVTSFDEMKAVVEILQGELIRKDQTMREIEARHRKELELAYKKIDQLYAELEKVKRRLNAANIGNPR